ncbi:hypothetical protein K466DRAFT_586049 [Polyporus arcularius HHB13444]|uniref:DUF6534 domain-containing protein n=1 Tax=Polyporus arcularius HHB13444 TaxID=1314778 RepID=A0A5C3PFQ8_9APHY|nr:hypothetical protein K466DRAFT_586049 [Polyporus arcularius HHB13444]
MKAMEDPTVRPLLQLPPLDNSLGALLLGTFAGVLLYGIILSLSLQYFRRYPNDKPFLKLWVWTILLLETLVMILFMHACYFYMVDNYLNPLALTWNPTWSLKLSPIPSGLSSITSELFFARRVWYIGRRYRPLVVIAIVMEMAFLGCFLYALREWNSPGIDAFLNNSWLLALGSGLIGAGDILMTSVLIYVLRRSRTGVKKTNWTLGILIKYAFTTGLLICIFQVLNIICLTVWSGKLIFIPPSIILTKIAAISFLVSLNARNWLATAEVTEMDQIQPFTTSLMPNAQASSASGSIAFRAKLSRMTSAATTTTTSQPQAIELTVMAPNAAREEGAVRDYLDIKAAAITESSTASLAASV